MGYLLIGSLLINSGIYYFFTKKNKYFTILFSVSIIIFFIILMGGNTENPDLKVGAGAYQDVYYNIYMGTKEFTKDIGYIKIMDFFHKFNFSFEVFHLICSGVGLLLLLYPLLKYIKNKPLLLMLYFIYPFLMDVVQWRNFLALSLFVFGFIHLGKDETQKIKLISICCLFLSCLIQQTFWAYLPFLFIKKIYTKKTKKYFNLIWLALTLVCFLKPIINQFNTILMIIAPSLFDTSENFLSVSTRFGWILNWGTQIVNFFIISRVSREVTAILPSNISKNNQKRVALINRIYTLNGYAFLFMPLYVINTTFGRLVRNLIILTYIGALIGGEILKEHNQRKKNNHIILLLIIYAVILFLSNFYIFFDYGETIINAIFRNNNILLP